MTTNTQTEIAAPAPDPYRFGEFKRRRWWRPADHENSLILAIGIEATKRGSLGGKYADEQPDAPAAVVDHLVIWRRGGGSDRIDNCVIAQSILAEEMTPPKNPDRNYAAILKRSDTGKAWIWDESTTAQRQYIDAKLRAEYTPQDDGRLRPAAPAELIDPPTPAPAPPPDPRLEAATRPLAPAAAQPPPGGWDQLPEDQRPF